jgi:hypothetical protein
MGVDSVADESRRSEAKAVSKYSIQLLTFPDPSFCLGDDVPDVHEAAAKWSSTQEKLCAWVGM